MTKTFFTLANILLICITISCNEETVVPKQYISKDKMVEIMTDIHLVEGLLQNNSTRDTTVARKAYDAYHFIYYKYRIDSSTFRKSWEYYATHPELYDDMQEKVVEKLNMMKN
jgi:hypothetical protein